MASRHRRLAAKRPPTSPRVGATSTISGSTSTLDNNPGAPDTLRGADDITGGPVHRFTFEYDMTLNGAGHGRQDRDPLRSLEWQRRWQRAAGGLRRAAVHRLLRRPDRGLRRQPAAGEQHFLSNGQAEGRQADLFSETQYLRNYGDLQAAFGTDVNAATAHFITSGVNEGRVDDAPRRPRSTACSTSPPTPT